MFIIICVFLSYGEHIQQIKFKYGSYIDRGKSELQTEDYRNWRPYHLPLLSLWKAQKSLAMTEYINHLKNTYQTEYSVL